MSTCVALGYEYVLIFLSCNQLVENAILQGFSNFTGSVHQFVSVNTEKRIGLRIQHGLDYEYMFRSQVFEVGLEREYAFRTLQVQYPNSFRLTPKNELGFESNTRLKQFSRSDAQIKKPSRKKVFLFVRRVGFEPTKPEGDRFTVCCDRPLHHRRILTQEEYTRFQYIFQDSKNMLK